MPGPIPKRSEERIRRNTPDIPIEKLEAIGPVDIPELNIGGNVHPLIEDLYESLKNSAQNKYYEPSDWHTARLAFHFLNKLVWSEKPSAEMLAQVNSLLSQLLMTEGERRRVRLEIERKPESAGGKVLDMSDVFRKRLEQG